MFIVDGAKIRNNFVISSTRRQKLTNFNIYNFHDSIATKNPRCRQTPGILFHYSCVPSVASGQSPSALFTINSLLP